MGGHGGSSGDSWDYRLDLGQQCVGVFNAVSLASQRDRAEEAQVRSGATTWSAWQRRIEASCSLREGSGQCGLQRCRLWAACFLTEPQFPSVNGNSTS